MEFALWFFVFLLGYTYIGYPILLWAIAALSPRNICASGTEPPITIIVAAFNEEKDIARKIEMLLELDYPPALRQIIVASDNSTDRTHEIVNRYSGSGVELVILPERGGKTAAQNMAIGGAKGEILIFTDATTELSVDSLKKLVAPFADSRVGCAGAKLEYVSAAGSAVGGGGGLYWRYEKKLKELESKANSLIGVSGCLYAVRRSLYQPISPDLISDFVIALDIWSREHITVYVPDAIGYEITNETADLEFSMRCRVIVRSIYALYKRAYLLNPVREGFFAIQLWSHKVFRYCVPELMIAILVVSIILASQTGPRTVLYAFLLFLQIATYVVVPLAYLACRRFGIQTRFLAAPFYFLLANAAAFWGLVSFLRGRRDVTWNTIRQS